MPLSNLDLLVIVVYFVGLAGFGIFVRRIADFSDYSVARRAVPLTVLAASLGATYIGPGYSLGLAGQAYSSGYLFFFLFLFFSAQTVVVGVFVANRLHGYENAHSVGDVMGELYGRSTQVLTGIISVGLCAGFAAVMARAGGAVLSGILDQPLWVGVALITVVGVIYTTTGGLKSVIATEAIQFVVMLVAVSALVLMARDHVESWSNLTAHTVSQTSAALGGKSALALVGLGLSFALGETLIPPYANRALAASSRQGSKAGFVVAGLYSIVWFGMIALVGVVASQILPPGTEPDAVFIDVASTVLPEGLLGLLVVAIAAIVMSSQESVLNAAAVSLTRDLVTPFREVNDGSAVWLARMTTVVLGLVSIFLALKAPSIIAGLLICYSIWATTVLPPLVWGVLGLRTTPLVGLMSLILGGTTATTTLLAVPGSGDTGLALVAGLAGATVGSLLGMVANRIRR